MAYNLCQDQAITDDMDVTNVFDVWDPGCKLLRDLCDDLLDQRLTLHSLTSLHDPVPVVSDWR